MCLFMLVVLIVKFEISIGIHDCMFSVMYIILAYYSVVILAPPPCLPVQWCRGARGAIGAPAASHAGEAHARGSAHAPAVAGVLGLAWRWSFATATCHAPLSVRLYMSGVNIIMHRSCRQKFHY